MAKSFSLPRYSLRPQPLEEATIRLTRVGSLLSSLTDTHGVVTGLRSAAAMEQKSCHSLSKEQGSLTRTPAGTVCTLGLGGVPSCFKHLVVCDNGVPQATGPGLSDVKRRRSPQCKCWGLT